MIVYSKKHKAYIVRIPGSGRADEVVRGGVDNARYIERWHEYSRKLREVPGYREADDRSFESHYGGNVC